MKKILLFIIPFFIILLSINTAYADEATTIEYYMSEEWQYFDTTEIGTDYVTFQYEERTSKSAKLWIYNHENNEYILYYSWAGRYGAVEPGQMKFINESYSSMSLNPPKFYWCFDDGKKYVAVEAVGRVCVYENGALESQDSFTPITPEPEPIPPSVNDDDSGLISGIVSGITNALNSVFNGIKDFFATLFEPILYVFNYIKDWFSSIFNFIENLYTYISTDMTSQIVEFFGSLNVKAVGLVSSVFDFPIISELLVATVAILIFSALFRLFMTL